MDDSTTRPDPSADTPAVMVPGNAAEIGGAFVDYIGLEFLELTGDRVRATWTAGPHLHQPHGIVHGGAHCSVVETLASMGATVWLDQSMARSDRAEQEGVQGRVVGVNNNTDFYRAVVEGGLTSTATPLHRGRSQQVWVVETHEDATGKLASRGQVRLQNLYVGA